MKALVTILKITVIVLYSCVWVCFGFLFMRAPWKLFRNSNNKVQIKNTSTDLDYIDEEVFDGK